MQPRSLSWSARPATACVEVEGVGEVQLAVDQRGAGEGDLVVVDGEVPPVGGAAAGLLGGLGHEPGDRLLDQPVDHPDADLVRDRRQVPVDVGRGLRTQRVGDGLLGDPTGLPGRQVPGGHPRPQPRQPVAQLEGVSDVALPGLGGQPDRGRELRDRELRHQRRPRAGDWDRRIAEPTRVAGGAEHLGGLQRLRRMLGRPHHRRLQQPASARSAAARSRRANANTSAGASRSPSQR